MRILLQINAVTSVLSIITCVISVMQDLSQNVKMTLSKHKMSCDHSSPVS